MTTSTSLGGPDDRLPIGTAAGGGLGRAYAKYLAQEVVHEMRAASGEAVANLDDVGDWKNCARMVEQAVGEFGDDLHIVVNNAGIVRSLPIVERNRQMREEAVRVDLPGHASLIGAAGRCWRDQPRRDRSVINSGSRVSALAESSRPASWAAAKAGTLMLTVVANSELTDVGVGCDAISPSALIRLAKDHPAMQANTSQKYVERFDPVNVVPLVAYPATPDCPITGQFFYVGGKTVQRYDGWFAGAELTSQTRWDIACLAAQVPELVAR